jgi:hypothetical protein
MFHVFNGNWYMEDLIATDDASAIRILRTNLIVVGDWQVLPTISPSNLEQGPLSERLSGLTRAEMGELGINTEE